MWNLLINIVFVSHSLFNYRNGSLVRQWPVREQKTTLLNETCLDFRRNTTAANETISFVLFTKKQSTLLRFFRMIWSAFTWVLKVGTHYRTKIQFQAKCFWHMVSSWSIENVFALWTIALSTYFRVDLSYQGKMIKYKVVHYLKCNTVLEVVWRITVFAV